MVGLIILRRDFQPADQTAQAEY